MIVLLVFAVVVLLVGAVLAVLGKVKADGATYNLRPWGVALMAVAVLMGLGSTIRDVGAREVGVPVTFGHLGSDMQPGVHFTNPFTKVTVCPVAQQADIQNADPSSGSAAYNQAVSLSGSDAGQATADVTVLYNISSTNADAVYLKYRCNTDLIQQNLVAQTVRSVVAQQATNYLTIDLKAERSAIEKASLATLEGILGPDGITVDQVTIGDLTLANYVQNAADQKLAAQQAVVTAGFAQQKAQIDAHTAQIEAKGIAEGNEAKQPSLTPQALCYDAIQAIQMAHPTVVQNWGPCAAASSAGSTSVIVGSQS